MRSEERFDRFALLSISNCGSAVNGVPAFLLEVDPGSSTLAAEASENVECVATSLTRWIAAVSAAEENLTTKNTKNTKNTKKFLQLLEHPPHLRISA